MERLIMKDWNREDTSFRDYVELWAGRWRQTDLWTVSNISNNYSRSQVRTQASISALHWAAQTEETFIWVSLRWRVAWHNVSVRWPSPDLVLGSCRIVPGSRKRSVFLALLCWARGSALGNLRSDGYMFPVARFSPSFLFFSTTMKKSRFN